MTANAGAPVDGRRIPPPSPVAGPTLDLPQFWFTTTREFAHLTIWLHGELDLAFHEQLVSAACGQLSTGRTSGVTVDLGGLDFLSVTGIGALIAIRRIAEQRDIPFALDNVPARIRRLFGICGAARSFHTRSYRWAPAPLGDDFPEAL